MAIRGAILDVAQFNIMLDMEDRPRNFQCV